MNRARLLVLLTGFGLLAGCYHATVDTGMSPSNRVIEKAFASSWIYGLVPPSTVQMAGQCPGGIAKVETRLSFVNGLVGVITGGIYTPMEIKVTCAEGSKMGMGEATPDIILPSDATLVERRDAFAIAAQAAIRMHRPVFVQVL